MDQTAIALHKLGAVLRERAIDIAKATELRVHDELFDYYNVPSPDFQAAGFDAVAAVLAFAWTTLEDDGVPPDQLPPDLVDEAVNAARNEVPWEVLDRSYHLTHEIVWDLLVETLASWRLNRAEHTLILQMASRCMFRCFDRLSTDAGRIYHKERADWVDRRQRRLVELVGDALDGLAVSDAELGYGTHQQQLAVVGWGRDPRTAITQAARTLSAEVLIVPSTGSSVWAWLGRSRFGPYEELARAFVPDAKTTIALGALEFGRRGFAASHHQAQLAASTAVRQLLAAPPSVVTYPMVAVETIALADETRARVFAAHVLGELTGDDTRSIKLRDTLRAYCQCNYSTALAAGTLGIAERTVRHRLQSIETQLGGAATRVEVSLAIRVFDALDAQRDQREIPGRRSPAERPAGSATPPEAMQLRDRRHGSSDERTTIS